MTIDIDKTLLYNSALHHKTPNRVEIIEQEISSIDCEIELLLVDLNDLLNKKQQKQNEQIELQENADKYYNYILHVSEKFKSCQTLFEIEDILNTSFINYDEKYSFKNDSSNLRNITHYFCDTNNGLTFTVEVHEWKEPNYLFHCLGITDYFLVDIQPADKKGIV